MMVNSELSIRKPTTRMRSRTTTGRSSPIPKNAAHYNNCASAMTDFANAVKLDSRLAAPAAVVTVCPAPK